MSGRLDGFVQWSYNVLSRIKLPVFVRPLFQVLAEGLARDGHVVAIYQFILEEESKDFYSREKKVNFMRTA